MSIAALAAMKDAMKFLEINYAFGEWTAAPVYPYFVGEYQEVASVNEDGMQESTFILTGFSRGSWYELEYEKEKIMNYFSKVGGDIVVTENNSVVAFFYSESLIVPTGEAELKKIQINLTVKEWSVK